MKALVLLNQLQPLVRLLGGGSCRSALQWFEPQYYFGQVCRGPGSVHLLGVAFFLDFHAHTHRVHLAKGRGTIQERGTAEHSCRRDAPNFRRSSH